FLGLTIAFDALAFSATIYFTVNRIRLLQRPAVLVTIQRDGIIYFATIFTMNLLWMILILHARVSFFIITINRSL
ncbi:hypothetical protein BDQ17DRAFT_1257593, partial [Cyathus striatus]